MGSNVGNVFAKDEKKMSSLYHTCNLQLYCIFEIVSKAKMNFKMVIVSKVVSFWVLQLKSNLH